jgi:chemotaxis methyl-accepting protein methylase
MSAPNLEVRRHDILKHDLEKDNYDLAHCRMVLMHLPEPEKALRRMADALRPGRLLLVEEDDRGSMLSMDVTGRFFLHRNSPTVLLDKSFTGSYIE